MRWGAVAPRLMEVNPALSGALSELSSEHDGFFEATYRYGELILDSGRFQAPCSRRDCEGCAQLLAETSYSGTPLAVVLSKSAEVFIDEPWDAKNPRLMPLRLFQTGGMFGVFEVLDRLLGTPAIDPIWSVSAGSRSIWIIAPLGDDRIARRFKEKASSFPRTAWAPCRTGNWGNSCMAGNGTPGFWFLAGPRSPR